MLVVMAANAKTFKIRNGQGHISQGKGLRMTIARTSPPGLEESHWETGIQEPSTLSRSEIVAKSAGSENEVTLETALRLSETCAY